MSESELPPPHPVLSALEWMALVWFLCLVPAERKRVLNVMRWVATLAAGPTKQWPIDFGRPIHEAEEVIVNNRSAGVWIGRLADQLEVVKDIAPH